jgi:cell division protein FtsI/penicillin-binding protein 2
MAAGGRLARGKHHPPPQLKPMAKRTQLLRLLWLALLLCVAFVGLGYRLVDLQVLRHSELNSIAQQNTQRGYLLPPRRGDILDAKGNLLATSTLVKTVCADPAFIGGHSSEVARVLAPLLQTNESRLAEMLTPKIRQNEEGQILTNRYVTLKQKVPVETWEKIRAAMAGLAIETADRKPTRAEAEFHRDLRSKAIFARDDQLRDYPNKAMAAHVLGYTGTEEKEVNGSPVKQLVGRDGIEHTLDAKLAGVFGWRQTETDRARRELVTLREQDVEPRDGLNVVLTVDSVLQHIVESALAEGMSQHTPISISGIIVRPRTGEILAMATLPNYDPNCPGRSPTDALRNRVIADIAEPGSTFKIVTVSGALNEGAVQLSDTFDCEQGHWAFAGKVLHDHERYGVLSVERIITKSSNIGAGKIGLKMGEARLYDYIRAFGFGQPTGIPLQAEVSGIVHPLKKWTKVSIAQIPMGQGIAVTRLQMMMAMCAIANKGVLMRPMLVDRLEDREHRVVAKYAPQRMRQVITEAAAKQMVQALKTVVSPEGTAPQAALEHYTVAGKTGTAQKAEGGVYVRKYFSSFLGFFPADNPELCISISMDEPKEGYYGGRVAAPIFKQVAERAANYLNIRPEDQSETPSVPSMVSPSADTRPLKTAAVSPH